MRVSIWLVLGLLLALLILDLTAYSLVRSKVREAVEHSLDAALVGGVNPADVARGYLTVNEARGQALARSCFQETLKLNDHLESESLLGTMFTIYFIPNEERPKVTAQVKTYIRAMSPRMLGLEGIPVRITKTQYHINKFK